ncbi:hypothetical protein [Micromonospora sp. NBC_00421]|uniref:hypothetical protein n=1 Tax=Micromonospora sp. NBC_00421 TaxID=2975976 RepID=UPI002E2358C1
MGTVLGAAFVVSGVAAPAAAAPPQVHPQANIVTEVGPASAHPGFAEQAGTAGLTVAQAEALQSQVDSALARSGGTQVSLNKIDLNGTGTIVLPLPGQDRAREVSASGEVGALYTCSYYHFCAFSGTSYSGSVIDMVSCRSYSIPWGGNGSWKNNQSTGTRARMYGSSGSLIYTTPGAYSSDSVGDWTPVWTVRPC